MNKLAAAFIASVAVTSCLPVHATVIAVKRDAGLTDVRGLDPSLASAISGGTAAVYSGEGAVADVGSLYTDPGWAQSEIYKNFGASVASAQWGTLLVKFGLNAIPGFSGSNVARAELRFYSAGGNSGIRDFGRVTSSDWIEGTADDGFPGVAGGVSGAHPMGYNTDAFQTANGTPVDVGGWPPNMSLAPFSWTNGQPFASSKDGVVDGSGMIYNPWGVTDGQWDQYITLDITSLLQSWASGANNYGMYINNGNYNLFMSENTTSTNWQPVLVMDYSPTPEPATLTLLVLGSVALIRRRANG